MENARIKAVKDEIKRLGPHPQQGDFDAEQVKCLTDIVELIETLGQELDAHQKLKRNQGHPQAGTEEY